VYDKIKLRDAYASRIRLNPEKSVPAPGAENEKYKTCDDHKNDDHPVLAFESKKGKVLDQKVQRPRAPIFRARRKIGVLASKIYYFYIFIQQWSCPLRHATRRGVRRRLSPSDYPLEASG
jgi:hypothetical protein